jgi:CubicO group peptidase (beta-lactamase class C family)
MRRGNNQRHNCRGTPQQIVAYKVKDVMLPLYLSCLSLALLACNVWGQSTPGPQDRIRAVETGLGPPVTVVGQPPDRRDLLAEMKRLHVPAVSIAIVQSGKIEWAKGYGITREGGVPVTPDTLFQAASITKSVTAMAALHLVEQGKLSLDAAIQTELKSWTLPQNSFTAQHPVTLRELLSNNAGTSVQGFDGYTAGEPIPTLKQILNGTKPSNSAPIVVEIAPGIEFHYSGGGFTIVQQAMIDSTGKAFPEIMKTIVLDPIGMHSSTYQQPIEPTKLRNVAFPVDANGAPIPGGPHIYPEMAAAGLWTTPSDFARWIIEVQDSLEGKANHVLSPAMTRTMLTKATNMPDSPDTGYGLGVAVLTIGGKPAFTHGGVNAGYQCTYFAYKNGDGLVVMTNSDNGDTLIHEITTSIAHEYGWPDPQEQRTFVTVPLIKQMQFVGKFAGKNDSNFEITSGKNSLQLSMNGDQPQPLLTSSPTSFFVTDSTLQMSFETPDRGVLIFGKQEVPFERVKAKTH